MSDDDLYDLVIVGAGPAGCTAAIYAARARLKTLLVDKTELGGSLAVAPKIANFPGVPQALSGAELAHILKQQALSFGAEYLQAPVLGIALDGDPKQVHTTEGPRQGRTIIIATGAMGRGRRAPGEDQFLGRGVSYCATCDAAFFDNEVVAVIGNSREAVDDALLLARFAAQVYLASPSARLMVDEQRMRAVEAEPKIALLPERTLSAVQGDDRVREIVLTARDGTSQTLAVGGVFIYLAGNKPVTDFLAGALDLTDEGCIRVSPLMEASISGVFAAGDVRCTEFRQAVTAAADGAIAAMSAERYVTRRDAFRPGR